MSTADSPEGQELVVGPDGSIPAEQLVRLGVKPGTHLRVVPSRPGQPHSDRLAGSQPDLPELTWTDFQRGSDLARSDLAGS